MKEREESRLSESPTGRAGTGTRRRARSPRIGFTRPNPNTVGTFLEVGIRSRNRNARSTRTLRPHDEGMEGVGRRNPSSAPTDVFFSLRARTNLPESSRKSGSKTARSAFGRRPKTEEASDGSESDVSKKRTEEPQRRRPRAAPASSVRFTRSRTPLGRASARSTNTVGQP